MDNIVFDPATHTYTENGIVVPSVTQILEQAGLVDFSMVKPGDLEYKRDRGTKIHTACELDDQDNLNEDSLDEVTRPCLEAWRKFKADFNFKIEAIEEMVFSKKYRYAGKLDRRGIISKRRAVVDIKTSSEIYPANALQLAGYQEAYNEDSKAKDKILDRYIVNVLEDGTYKLIQYQDVRDKLVFFSAVNVAKFRRENGLWKPTK